jgi:hypothetical protein
MPRRKPASASGPQRAAGPIPTFAGLCSDSGGDTAGRAVGELADGMAAAAKALRGLLDCESPAVRLGAARSLLEIGMKAREALDLEERVRALEERTDRFDGPLK